ncbi:MAG: hypothetical protein K2Q25_01130 [Mycobacteriaceae bacterium]|nr:hypothetical protein [Mycobacteriaceae bacterium]
MPTALRERLVSVLCDVIPGQEEPDGALTLRHDNTFASLRVVTIVEDLELVALTQVLAWDLPLTNKVRTQVAEQADNTLLGSLTVREKPGPHGRGSSTKNSDQLADVLLRYNFPGAGLTDEALRTLILMVLDKGAQIRREITA